MLGKLFKAEWKATSKWLLPLQLVLIVVTIMGKIILSTGLLENGGLVALSFLLTTFYVLSIFAISIITTVLLVMRFYKSLFTDEGYLTFTLPVKSHQLLISKISIASLWILINSIFTVLSVAILLLDKETFKEMMSSLPELNQGLEIMLGFSGFGAILFIIAFFLVSILGTVLMFAVSICIGQLMTKHKVLGAVLSYIGIYTILQIVSSIGMVGFGIMTSTMGSINDTIILNDADIMKVYNGMFPILFVANVVLIGIYFAISNHIMKYKVNLD